MKTILSLFVAFFVTFGISFAGQDSISTAIEKTNRLIEKVRLIQKGEEALNSVQMSELLYEMEAQQAENNRIYENTIATDSALAKDMYVRSFKEMRINKLTNKISFITKEIPKAEKPSMLWTAWRGVTGFASIAGEDLYSLVTGNAFVAVGILAVIGLLILLYRMRRRIILQWRRFQRRYSRWMRSRAAARATAPAPVAPGPAPAGPAPAPAPVAPAAAPAPPLTPRLPWPDIFRIIGAAFLVVFIAGFIWLSYGLISNILDVSDAKAEAVEKIEKQKADDWKHKTEQEDTLIKKNREERKRRLEAEFALDSMKIAVGLEKKRQLLEEESEKDNSPAKEKGGSSTKGKIFGKEVLSPRDKMLANSRSKTSTSTGPKRY